MTAKEKTNMNKTITINLIKILEEIKTNKKLKDIDTTKLFEIQLCNFYTVV
jgi:hypothetical protein